MSKKKLNIVLDIGKTNVKLVFLDEKGQFFKEIKKITGSDFIIFI